MADTQDSDNPLIKTLPPAIDYIHYLIVIEHNLNKEQLPTLHGVLQDTQLTANIGWDLVHLLLPLLPESRQCLQDVARLGNPREVVLKVTELLEGINAEEEDEDQQETEGDGDEEGKEDNNPTTNATTASTKQIEDLEAVKLSDSPLHPNGPTANPQVLRYANLVEMLSILHPRIKTQYPSRFLSTSLQAVLPAHAQVARDPLATEATLDLIKNLLPSQRPRLPPRKSSSHVPTTASVPASAPDPEAQEGSPGTDEAALQARLVQSFLTYVVEGFVSGLKKYEDIPGLAWSCRYHEKTHPEKRVPGSISYLAVFVEDEEELHTRDTVLGRCLAISRDLKIHPRELLSTISHEDSPENEDENALPSKASDVPLSRIGSLYLFCALAASSSLFDAPANIPPVKIFPDFAGILTNCLSANASSVVGGEAESLIDAVLFLGSLISTQHPDVSSANDEQFHNTLQHLSLLSANIPSSALRYQAHLLTSSLLRLHPTPDNRLAFIKDTLEYCPYENLKASAVGWLKDEILAAQPSSKPLEDVGNAQISIFATPAVLTVTAPLLLVDPSTIIHKQRNKQDNSGMSKQAETYAIFQANLSFVLAVLNFLYLLLSSSDLSRSLQVKSLDKEFDIIGYGDRMRAASLLFQGWIADEEGGQGGDDKNARIAELQLLDQAIERVMEAAGAVGLP